MYSWLDDISKDRERMAMLNKNENIENMNIAGYKNTKQRNKIIQILKNAQAPMAVEEIYLLIKKESNSISISTIYRNMEALLEKSIITKTIYNDGKSRYELVKKEHIHHLICLKCKKSMPMEKCPMELIKKNIRDQDGFEVLEHKIEIYGHCKNCKLKQSEK